MFPFLIKQLRIVFVWYGNLSWKCRDRKRVVLPFMLRAWTDCETRDCNNRLFVLRKKKIELQTDKIDLGENTTTCTDKVRNIKSGENLQTWEFPLSASAISRQKGNFAKSICLGTRSIRRAVFSIGSVGTQFFPRYQILPRPCLVCFALPMRSLRVNFVWKEKALGIFWELGWVQ